MSTAATVRTTVRAANLDPATLPAHLVTPLARSALVAAATGHATVSASTIESDKRSQARVVRELVDATDAIARAQARHAALLKRYTKVAVANPGLRPYDAMRARFEQWLAESIVHETGVDPRALPETER